MKKGILLILGLLTFYPILELHGQDEKFDSLWNIYNNTEQDTSRIQLLLDIGDIYRFQMPDTALYYYNKVFEISGQTLSKFSHDQSTSIVHQNVLQLYEARSYHKIGIVHAVQSRYDMAIDYFIKALKIFEKLEDKKGMALEYNYIGLGNKDKGNFEIAIKNFSKAIELEEELGNKNEIAHNYNNIGVMLLNLGNYNKAMESHLKALEISKEIGDKGLIIYCYNNIGIIHSDQGHFDMALENYLKALKISEELLDKKRMSMCYLNVGSIYHTQGIYDKAMEFYLKSIKLKEELGDIKNMPMCYNNMGVIYEEQGNYDKAMEIYLKAFKISKEYNNIEELSYQYSNMGIIHELQNNYDKAMDNYLKSIEIRKTLGDKEGLATNYGNIAKLYIRLADTCGTHGTLWTAYLNSALTYAKKAYNLSGKIGALPKQKDAAAHLQEAYTKLGVFKEAIKYAEIYIATLDSMFSTEKTKALAEMTSKYEAEKKQLQIEKLEKQKELDNKTIEAQQAKHHKQQIMIFSALGGLLIVLVFLMIILHMLRQKRQANVLLATQNDEINQQKDKIEEQNKSITDSIVYAQRIQRALLPPGDYMKQLLPHRFIFYKPRDIVSGDFYWINKKDGLIITASADCTGHGVPGAMMSMLGVSILNEIVNTMQELDAAEILNNLRTKIIDSLHQRGEDNNTYDGMDLALCLIDLKKMKVQFAGANCPLYLIREGELTEVKGDKMPIGIHVRMDVFRNHAIKLQKGDILYTFSDGYIDQFGGVNEKRFTQRRFKELLLNIHDKPMTDQKEYLDKIISEWQGKTDQIDDILVMGVRI